MKSKYKFKFFEQKGAILVVSIMLLLILTMLGIAALNTSSVSEKMTQNLRDTTASFDAAESALAFGEGWVQAQTAAPVAVTTCSTPPCSVWQSGVWTNLNQQSSSWWTTNAISYGSTLSTVSTQPRFVIELYSFTPYELSPDVLSKARGYFYYRITAKGTGTTNNGVTFVQSIYATQFN